MDKKIAIGLIKLDVLNNIDSQDSEALQYLKRNDDDFPWKELGDYQNLIATLAVTSKLEVPDPDLKTKILSRLYDFKKPAAEGILESTEEGNSDAVEYAEATTQKFKIDNNIENSNHSSPDLNEKEHINISEPETIQKVTIQEPLYEIEEYDLDMNHEDIKIHSSEATAEPDESLAHENRNQNSIYEIEEYDLEIKSNTLAESVDAEIGSSQDVASEIQIPPTENNLSPAIGYSDSEENQLVTGTDNSDPYTEDDFAEQVNINSSDNETTESLTVIIPSAEELEVVPVNKPIEQPVKTADDAYSKKTLLEKHKPAQTDATGDSISFREPNLSQLQILFKDNPEITYKEKETRLEYRAKIAKEQTEKVVVQEDKNIEKEVSVPEVIPAAEIKTTQDEVIPPVDSLEENEKPLEESTTEKIKSPVTLKKESGAKSFKKAIFIAAAILIICASVLYYMQTSNKNVEPVKIVKSEQKPITYEKVVEEKKPESLVAVQEIVPANQKDIITTLPEKKLPSPPKQPVPIEPEVITTIQKFSPEKTGVTENIKKEELRSPPKEERKVEEEPVYFVAVEEMPAPVNGLKEMQSRISYPQLAKLAGVEGKVLVLAYVNESGNVTNVELIKGIGAGCDEVALNVVKQTKFKPGLQRGKPVKVKITVPIVFKLK